MVTILAGQNKRLISKNQVLVELDELGINIQILGIHHVLGVGKHIVIYE